MRTLPQMNVHLQRATQMNVCVKRGLVYIDEYSYSLVSFKKRISALVALSILEFFGDNPVALLPRKVCRLRAQTTSLAVEAWTVAHMFSRKALQENKQNATAFRRKGGDEYRESGARPTIPIYRRTRLDN